MKVWSPEGVEYTVLTFVWMNIDVFNPKSHVPIGVIALTILIFLMGCQHWWLGLALTKTVGLPVILITVT